MTWLSFMTGAATGGAMVAIGFWASGFAHALDQGVSLTYAHAEQDALRNESDVLRRMAEPSWIGLSATEAKTKLTALGLFDFEKGSEGFAAGPVFLRVQDDNVVEIEAHCARMKTDDCKAKGVN